MKLFSQVGLILTGAISGGLLTVGVLLIFSEAGIMALIENYQTLIAGLIAFAGAAITVRAMRNQIHQSAVIAEDGRRRKSRAARSVMPAALSSLVSYTHQCAQYGSSQRDRIERNEHRNTESHSPELPLYPIEIIPTLRDCSEYADDGPADTVSDLLGDLQVLNSRLRTFDSSVRGDSPDHTIRIVTTRSADNVIYDAVHLRAVTESLFPYARRQENERPAPITREDIRRCLRLSDIELELLPSVYQILDEEFPEVPEEAPDN